MRDTLYRFMFMLAAMGMTCLASTQTNKSASVGGRLRVTLGYPSEVAPGSSVVVVIAVSNLTDQAVACSFGVSLGAHHEYTGKCMTDYGGSGTNTVLNSRSGLSLSGTVWPHQYATCANGYIGALASVSINGEPDSLAMLDVRMAICAPEIEFTVTNATPLTVGSSVTVSVRCQNPYPNTVVERVQVDVDGNDVFGGSVGYVLASTTISNVPPLAWFGVTNTFIATGVGQGKVGYSVFGTGLTHKHGEVPLVVGQ